MTLRFKTLSNVILVLPLGCFFWNWRLRIFFSITFLPLGQNTSYEKNKKENNKNYVVFFLYLAH